MHLGACSAKGRLGRARLNQGPRNPAVCSDANAGYKSVACRGNQRNQRPGAQNSGNVTLPPARNAQTLRRQGGDKTRRKCERRARYGALRLGASKNEDPWEGTQRLVAPPDCMKIANGSQVRGISGKKPCRGRFYGIWGQRQTSATT
jgi:hypothetical protein